MMKSEEACEETITERDEQGRKKGLTLATLRAVFIPELLRHIAHFIGRYTSYLPVLFVNKLANSNLKSETPQARVAYPSMSSNSSLSAKDKDKKQEKKSDKLDDLEELVDKRLPLMASVSLAK